MKSPSLSDWISIHDGALTNDFCSRLVDAFEAQSASHSRNGAGVRIGLEQSRWIELDIGRFADRGFLEFFRHQISDHLRQYNAARQLTIPVPDSPVTDKLIMKRYLPGGLEGFQPHFDAVGPSAGRYLVFLWYLNDVIEGGETFFCDIGMRISAKAGRLVIFPPYWMFQHAGLAPVSGPKYILSTYLIFP